MKFEQPWVILEDRRALEHEKKSYLFEEPVDEFLAFHPNEIANQFKLIELASHSGLYLVGYLAYEAAYTLVPILEQGQEESTRPLLHFFAFKRMTTMNQKELRGRWQNRTQDYAIKNIHLMMNAQEYETKFAQIQKHLFQGDSYQINFTNKYRFDFQGDPLSFYLELRKQQKVSYSGFLQFGRAQILSCSPELFLLKKGNSLLTKPMKGTMPRHFQFDLDQKFKQELLSNEKLKAENLIIVDLLRNDLSAIAQTGSVEVLQLLEIESYETLHQMTTTIQAQLKENLSLFEIFKAMFPCGSITGAPKKRTMQIIHALEGEDRHLYTGSIGYILPNTDFCFNVAIRSIYIENNQAELGIGGGITYDSECQQEFIESKLKAKFFIRSIDPGMVLFESILWHQTRGLYLLEEHLLRLRTAAYELGFPFDEDEIQAKLAKHIINFVGQHYKIKLLLERNGRIQLESQPIELANPKLKPKVGLYLSKYLDSHHPLLAYKIANSEVRRFYQDARSQYPHLWDLIFVNERQEISETSIGNVILEINGEKWTPPLSSGLLPGIMRSKLKVKEKTISIQELRAANHIWIVNSVRGMQEVELCPKSY